MKSVLVLLSSYNGEQYIKEQIESLMNQEGIDVKLLIRDDGSTDKTVKIVRKLQKNNNIELVCGKNIGYAASFMTLVHLASEIKADYYAFCDQDDVWEKEKLKIAVSQLIGHESKPSLYLSQAKIVDADLNIVNVYFHKRKVELGAVLEHNYAIGCTMVFNEELRKVLDIEINKMCLRCGHDSWVYLVALAINSYVFFDLNGYVLYRQHGKNASGKIISIRQAIRAVIKVLIKWKQARSDTSVKLLDAYYDLIPSENKNILEQSAFYMESFSKKMQLMKDDRMKSEYLSVDLLFKIAVLFNLY